MLSQMAKAAILPLLPTAVLLSIAAVISYRNPSSILVLERDQDATVDARIDHFVLWFIPQASEHSTAVTGSRYDALRPVVAIVGDPELRFPVEDEGQPRLIAEFLDDASKSRLRTTTHVTLMAELLFGGLGVVLLVGAWGGYFFHLRHQLPFDASEQEVAAIGVDQDTPAEILAVFSEEQLFTKITCWQPGQRVSIERKLTLGVYLMMIGLAAMTGALLGAHYANAPGAIVLGVLAPFVMLVVFEKKMYFRKVDFDWSRQRVFWTCGPIWRSKAFSAISDVVIDTIAGKHEDGPFRSRLAIQLKSNGKRIPLIDTLVTQPSNSKAKNQLKPIAREINRCLR